MEVLRDETVRLLEVGGRNSTALDKHSPPLYASLPGSYSDLSFTAGCSFEVFFWQYTATSLSIDADNPLPRPELPSPSNHGGLRRLLDRLADLHLSMVYTIPEDIRSSTGEVQCAHLNRFILLHLAIHGYHVHLDHRSPAIDAQTARIEDCPFVPLFAGNNRSNAAGLPRPRLLTSIDTARVSHHNWTLGDFFRAPWGIGPSRPLNEYDCPTVFLGLCFSCSCFTLLF